MGHQSTFATPPLRAQAPSRVTVFGVGSTNLYLGRLSVWYGLHTEFSNAPAPLAQSVEHRTFNPLVEGSSPSGRTNLSSEFGVGAAGNLLKHLFGWFEDLSACNQGLGVTRSTPQTVWLSNVVTARLEI